MLNPSHGPMDWLPQNHLSICSCMLGYGLKLWAADSERMDGTPLRWDKEFAFLASTQMILIWC